MNKKVQRILFYTGSVPLLFALFTKLNVWRIQYVYSLGLFIYIFCCYTVEFLLNGNQKYKRVSMYFGLISLCGVALLLFANRKVGASISLAIIPFLSCMYYDKKLTLLINIINAVFLIIAVFIRFSTVNDNAIRLDVINNAPTGIFAYIVGVFMELFFLALCTYILSENAHKSYEQILSLAEKQKKLSEQLQLRNDDLQQTQYKIIQFTGRCLGGRDFSTGRHVIHTQEFLKLTAHQLQKNGLYSSVLSDDEIATYANAAFLHEIGKVHIPVSLLGGQRHLSQKENDILKAHTEEGVKLLELLPQIGGGHFNEIAKQMAFYHHEAWDGSGYPEGLRGEEIPLCARILAVAGDLDTFIFSSEQFSQENPVNGVPAALDMLREQSGIKYDPRIADTVIRLRAEIEVLVNQFCIRESASTGEDGQRRTAKTTV